MSLVTLYSLIAPCNAATATVHVRGSAAVARTSPLYTSWTADCNGIADNQTNQNWKPSACFIEHQGAFGGGYPWGDIKLQNLVKDAYPRGSLMRIGGLADSVWFDEPSRCADNNKYAICMTKDDWRAFFNFAKATGARVYFSLNAMTGRGDHAPFPSTAPKQPWDPTNAKKLLRFTKRFPYAQARLSAPGRRPGLE